MLRKNSRNGITRNGNRPQRIGDQLLFFYFGQKQEDSDPIIILYAGASEIFQKIKNKKVCDFMHIFGATAYNIV